jgi:hypothetical protein
MAIGITTIDFGNHPGSNEASVNITGQTEILSTSKVEVFIMADDSTSDHTSNDHRHIQLFVNFIAGNIVENTGFTIYAKSLYKMSGTWKIRWVWI